jgi:two-component system, NarL family, response regulator DevR
MGRTEDDRATPSRSANASAKKPNRAPVPAETSASALTYMTIAMAALVGRTDLTAVDKITQRTQARRRAVLSSQRWGLLTSMDDSSAQQIEPIKVFLLDDHEIVRRGIADLLHTTKDLLVTGEASTVAEALHRIPAARPDVAVLDARLPDGSGIELCREIRSSFPQTQCLILTSYDDDEALFSAVMAGAAGYLLKEIRGSSLTDAIRQVAAGRSLLDTAVTGKLLERLRHPPTEDPRLASLTERERQILDLIVDGLTNREIGARLFLAEKTVKNYVSALLMKLNMASRTQAAVFGSQFHRPPDGGPSQST